MGAAESVIQEARRRLRLWRDAGGDERSISSVDELLRWVFDVGGTVWAGADAFAGRTYPTISTDLNLRPGSALAIDVGVGPRLTLRMIPRPDRRAIKDQPRAISGLSAEQLLVVLVDVGVEVRPDVVGALHPFALAGALLKSGAAADADGAAEFPGKFRADELRLAHDVHRRLRRPGVPREGTAAAPLQLVGSGLETAAPPAEKPETASDPPKPSDRERIEAWLERRGVREDDEESVADACEALGLRRNAVVRAGDLWVVGAGAANVQVRAEQLSWALFSLHVMQPLDLDALDGAAGPTKTGKEGDGHGEGAADGAGRRDPAGR